MKKQLKKCKQCGKDFEPCHKTSEFCSKSCATTYRNNQKIKDGSHNFYKLDRSKIALDKVKNGTHPFLNGNMSEDALKRKAEGIKKARLLESQNRTHPWQNPKNYIENEYSRSINTSKSRKISKAILYMAETRFSNTFKIGWTYDIKIREKDTRTDTYSNFKELLLGSSDDIIKLERDIKLNFFKEDYYKNFGSTEIFPNELLNEILNYIDLNKPSTTIPLKRFNL